MANLQRANVSKENVAEMTIDGYAAWTSKPSYAGGGNSFQYDSNRSIHFRTLIRVLNKDGQVKVANNDELQLTDCTEAIVLIANVTSFNGNDMRQTTRLSSTGSVLISARPTPPFRQRRRKSNC